MRRLPPELREKLGEPIGTLATNEAELLRLIRHERFVVTVGDQVTFTLLKHGICPRICIVDFVIKRKTYPQTMRNAIQQYTERRIKINNPPGCISDDLWNALESAYKLKDKEPLCIEVDGEEDLASLAAIYLASRDVTIIYGLPNKGVIIVKATEEHKRKVKEILDKMT